MAQHDRYSRQIRFAPIGSDGQEQIANASVAVLGCGALGTVASELLVRAGIGNLLIVDRDVVEWSNLQRQSLFDEQDAREGIAKVEAAKRRLSRINSEVEIQLSVADVTSENVHSVLASSDLVVDATDNFATRFLVNDWSIKTRTPWVHGGCVGATGQVMLFSGHGNPCFRCFVPEPPPAAVIDTCDTAGVLNAATHLIASLQVAEAIKWVVGDHQSVRKQLCSIDLWNNRTREVSVSTDVSSQCPACNGNFQFLNCETAAAPEAVLCGRDAVQIAAPSNQSVDLAKFAKLWKRVGQIQSTPFFVRLHADQVRTLTLFRDGRVIVSGTSEISEARILYDRFIGG